LLRDQGCVANPRGARRGPNCSLASNDSARRNNLSKASSNRASLACGEGTAMAETRKLAAILAADVVGYSKLAGSDEERTLARLRALRSDLIDPTIAVHHGRVVKRTGDGVLIEFRSVVDAVRCAIEMQNGMVERNAGLPPERRIEFRVGISSRRCSRGERRRPDGRCR
jgi:class 3 adenylate cyclase